MDTTLLEHKLRFLDTLASVGMSWWVSGIVFCATILAGCWLKRKIVVTVPFFHFFCATLTVFYFSVVSFGFFMSWETGRLEEEIRSVIGNRTPRISFETVKYGYLIGTTSFALIAICWLGLWRELWRLRANADHAQRL